MKAKEEEDLKKEDQDEGKGLLRKTKIKASVRNEIISKDDDVISDSGRI